VFGIARQRYPAKRTSALAKQWADVFRHKARYVECVLDSSKLSMSANVIAVVKRDGSLSLQLEHRPYMRRHAFERSARVFLGVALPQRGGPIQREAGRDVSIQRVVSAGLIGQQVRDQAAARHFWKKLGAVPDQADGY